ncbi:hypothetical protein RJ639_016808 [Escallonia herrerae]|uniref:Tify domain-containing protein n=1 Tax=Escallonia herrerae TaxID=1293975 RepID=A0AA88VCQ4_9ASTE|nr:hypothetical protein RJ639_016808 [Escallonia herrerae]
MKRELAFALESQSQLIHPTGRTRTSKLHSPVDLTTDSSDCPIDSPPPPPPPRTTAAVAGQTGQCNGFAVYRRNKRFKTAKPDGESVNSEEFKGESKEVGRLAMRDGESVNLEESKGGIPEGDAKVLRDGECVNLEESKSGVKEEEEENEAARRYTQLALRGMEGAELLDDEVESGGDSEVETATRKMEMKMSKKIAVNRRPTTVRELFETGLLEGYPVYYNGGKKTSRSEWQIRRMRKLEMKMTIKIAVNCRLTTVREPFVFCLLETYPVYNNGGKKDGFVVFCAVDVVSPSVFEIHACKAYKRASQYICLENGTSLLDAVKACEKSSLKSLEQTIQGVIGPSPVQDSIICQNCNGSMKSQASSTNATGLKDRYAFRNVYSHQSVF